LNQGLAVTNQAKYKRTKWGINRRKISLLCVPFPFEMALSTKQKKTAPANKSTYELHSWLNDFFAVAGETEIRV